MSLQSVSPESKTKKKSFKFNNRIKVFDYTNFDVILDRKFKSVVVNFSATELNSELLFELETFVKWCKQHIEVNCLYFKSDAESIFNNLDYSFYNSTDKFQSINSEEKIKKLFSRWQNIIKTMFHLPQTIVVDFGEEARGLALEFSLAADIRVARKTSNIKFDQLLNGHSPLCGAAGLLSLIVPSSYVKAWILATDNISEAQLESSGFINHFYNEDEDLSEKFFELISKQSPVARIQTKKTFLMSLVPEIERISELEFKIAEVSLGNNDWKRKLDNEPFMSARDFIDNLRPHDSKA